MLKVTLVAHTPDPDKTIAVAAKMCYSADGADKIMESLSDERCDRFIDMLMRLGHESPFEHASFTFAIEGVSRSLLAQITRHRIASFSVKSQRYVCENNFEFILPPAIANNPEAKEIYMKAMGEDVASYNALADILRKDHTERLMAEGMEESEAKKAAEKMAIEDARFVLPNACETKMMVTMNVRSLWNFFRLRCCSRAQWEIRALADEMLKLCKEVSPKLFSNAGPACVKGACPEGKMTCGKATMMRRKYKEEM